MLKTKTINPQEEQLIYALQLLGDKTRFKMFSLLINGSEMCVGELATQLGVSSSAVSQHCRGFELVGFIDKHRSKQKICYALRRDNPLVHELAKIVQSHTDTKVNIKEIKHAKNNNL